MTYGSGILQSIYSGTFDSYSGGQIYACDFYYWNATSSGSAGAGVSLFVNYNWNHTCQTGLKHYFFRIGDGINTDATCQQQLTTTPYNCNGSIVKSGLQSGSGFVLLNNLAAGTTYRLGMEVEMGVWETSQSYSFNMATNIYAQFTFNGKNTDY